MQTAHKGLLDQRALTEWTVRLVYKDWRDRQAPTGPWVRKGLSVVRVNRALMARLGHRGLQVPMGPLRRLAHKDRWDHKDPPARKVTPGQWAQKGPKVEKAQKAQKVALGTMAGMDPKDLRGRWALKVKKDVKVLKGLKALRVAMASGVMTGVTVMTVMMETRGHKALRVVMAFKVSGLLALKAQRVQPARKVPLAQRVLVIRDQRGNEARAGLTGREVRKVQVGQRVQPEPLGLQV